MSKADVEVVRRAIEASNRRDVDAIFECVSPDVVFDATHRGFGIFEGREIVLRVGEAWVRTFDEFEMDFRVVGDEVIFVVNTMWGFPLGSAVEVRQRGGFVYEFQDRLAVRCTAYSDVEEGRAAAERLAKERNGG